MSPSRIADAEKLPTHQDDGPRINCRMRKSCAEAYTVVSRPKALYACAVPHDSRRLLILDAQLLVRQYAGRLDPETSLDAAQRKQWAAEVAALLTEMSAALEELLPLGHIGYQDWGHWNDQMREKRRPVTFKPRTERQ